MDRFLKRHILKTISYRLFGTLTTIVTAYVIGVPIIVSTLIGLSELIIKPLLYFFHERVWHKIKL
jgi:uncharacterized membrane protein